jgi:hypothetical protein
VLNQLCAYFRATLKHTVRALFPLGREGASCEQQCGQQERNFGVLGH